MTETLYPVGRLDEIPENARIVVTVEGDEILVCRAGGGLFAISNVCAHQHVSVLHSGTLEDCAVTCPRHGWTYDLGTGRSTTGNGAVRSYPLVVVGDRVFIRRS